MAIAKEKTLTLKFMSVNITIQFQAKPPNDWIDAGETATRNVGENKGRFYEASCFASRPMIC